MIAPRNLSENCNHFILIIRSGVALPQKQNIAIIGNIESPLELDKTVNTA